MNSNDNGQLYIISAASGTGKTSLVNALLKRLHHVALSISYTTRPKRAGEAEGVDYHFIDQNRFDQMMNADEFLEYARVFGKSYGTAKKTVETQLAAGQDVILEIDWQGAEKVRQLMPDSVSIFILPPSLEMLRERILGRNQDELAVIEKRLQAASDEISHYQDYDYLIVNDDFDEALHELEAIMLAERCRTKIQSNKWKALLNKLTGV